MGDALLKDIRTLLSFHFDFSRPKKGDVAIFEELQQRFREDHNNDRLNSYLMAGRKIVDASEQAMSIDNLVDALEDEEASFMAKMAIVRAIHQAESASLCAKRLHGRGEELDLSVFSDHWYSSLSKLLFEGIRRSTVDDIFNNLQIINFNYDRCLEEYLPASIAKYFGMRKDEAFELLGDLPIHRPYGIAGDLGEVGFGGKRRRGSSLSAVAEAIHTFTEQVTDQEALQQIHGAILTADRIVFLGFAFHRQNLKLLETQTQDHVAVLATAYGISSSDQSVIEKEVAETFQISDYGKIPDISLMNMKCADFFRENWRTLTAGPNS